MPSEILLRILPSQGAAHERRLLGGELIIGRSSNADLTLSDRFLSRRHTRIFADGDTWQVEDLGSHNGTLLNGQRLTKIQQVRPGDTLVLSGTTIRIQDPTASRLETKDGGIADIRSGSGLASDPGSGSGDSGVRKILRDATIVLPRDPGLATNQESLRRYADRLRLLNEIHDALARSVSLDDLFELILDRAFETLQPENGWIFVRREGRSKADASAVDQAEDGDIPFDLEAVASRGLQGAAPEPLESRSLAREVVGQRMAALVVDAETDERFSAAQSLLVSGIKSLLAAPLLAGDQTLGMIVLSSRAHVRLFSEEDIELLATLASVAALRIQNVALAFEAAERKRLEDELSLARRIQERLLPDRLPELDGWSIAARNVPSRGVSGDYFTLVERTVEADADRDADHDELVLMLADVSGKGMAASLLTASLEALSIGSIEIGWPPEEICRRVSRRLHERTPPEKYATAIVAALDPSSGKLRFTNAGHNPGLVVRADGTVEHLDTTGLPIGILPGAEYEAGEVDLDAGDFCVVYTDGITEAENPEGDEYGLERLEALCVRAADLEPESLIQALGADLAAFAEGVPFADDRTIVVLRRDG